MNWLSVRVSPGDARDAALGALFEMGSQGVQEAGDDLVTHFPEETDAARVVAAVLSAAPHAKVAATLIEAG